MNTKKIIALFLTLAMVLSLAACGGNTDPSTSAAPTTTGATEAPTTPTTVPATTVPVTTAPVDPVVPVESSVNFEDGNMDFITLYDGRANADASTLELVDWNGSTALKVTNGSGKVPYVAFDIWSLLGENAANVRSIEMTMGIENPDGKFYACSGEVILWASDKLSSTTYGWSVYLQNKNPKTATIKLADYEAFSADVAPVMVVTLTTDNGATAGAANAILYIDDIRFLDADGNLIAADTSASFNAPQGFAGSKDMSNLKYLKNTVSLDGMAGISGDGWGQNGVEMTEDFIAALVPGAIIEIEYSTDSPAGDLWIVMPWATVGWSRIQQQSATKNNSLNICQITYEQIAAVCGDDVTTWGAMFQCESDYAWEVYSVKVGQDSGLVSTTSKTEIEGVACVGSAWGQNGPELTDDQIALLKAGAILEIEYSSTEDDLWIVLPDAAAGWTRIEMMSAACNGTVCQITFEQIAAVLGEDVSQWFANGKRLQFESSGDWEVYAASICKPAVNVSGLVDLGIAVSGGGWAQEGAELTDEQKALFVPGSVLSIQYTSETGNLWIVFPDDGKWSRVASILQDDQAACDGETCVITYEQIVAVMGEDIAAWFANGNRIQFESDGAWEVYSVSIGMASGGSADNGGSEDNGNSEDNGGEETPVIPDVSIPEVPEGATELYSGTTAMSGWQMVTQINTTVWGGTVEPTIMTDGGYFSVYFTGIDVYSMHFCLNGSSWVQFDCELANATQLEDGTYVATFSCADLVAAYGEDVSALGAFMVYSNSDAAGYAIVTLVTYTPAA